MADGIVRHQRRHCFAWRTHALAATTRAPTMVGRCRRSILFGLATQLRFPSTMLWHRILHSIPANRLNPAYWSQLRQSDVRSDMELSRLLRFRVNHRALGSLPRATNFQTPGSMPGYMATSMRTSPHCQPGRGAGSRSATVSSLIKIWNRVINRLCALILLSLILLV